MNAELLAPLALWSAAVILRFHGQFHLSATLGLKPETWRARFDEARRRTRATAWACSGMLVLAAGLGAAALFQRGLNDAPREGLMQAAFVVALGAAACGALSSLDEYRLARAAFEPPAARLLRRILWGELCFYALFPAAVWAAGRAGI
ncbi:MAG: hypothetical protein M5U26_10910 [Planctomycetota bacterium]|nr:hypothetical protein [Planctomycetota bacterium]